MEEKRTDGRGEPRMVPTFEGWESDADAFEEGLVDAAWIPDLFSWMSLGEFRERVDELEEYVDEILNSAGSVFQAGNDLD
ncbi:MAG TPA: hypothetical protein GXZ36_02160 [Firmicutes bacterium]|nr:hypothetical protein [Bacillota bacterium]